MADKERDKWDKIDILLKPVLTALLVAGLGFIAQNTLENRQRIETKAQLYADLMSKREEAESGLRKDMFRSVIESFLKPEPKASIGPKEKVLNLELLVSNFHESLNLKPLFVDLRKEIGGSKKDSQESKEEYLDRLDSVARDATRKQMLILETYGGILESTVDLKNREFVDKDTGERTTFDDQDITVDKVKRHFQLKIEAVDMKTKVIRLRVNVTTPTPDGETKVPDVELSFRVGFFDFPMIDNTRLSGDQRYAVILDSFQSDMDEPRAHMTLICFPGAYAGLKDKPYYQDVVN